MRAHLLVGFPILEQEPASALGSLGSMGMLRIQRPQRQRRHLEKTSPELRPGGRLSCALGPAQGWRWYENQSDVPNVILLSHKDWRRSVCAEQCQPGPMEWVPTFPGVAWTHCCSATRDIKTVEE